VALLFHQSFLDKFATKMTAGRLEPILAPDTPLANSRGAAVTTTFQNVLVVVTGMKKSKIGSYNSTCAA
jgi:hypothetical protein